VVTSYDEIHNIDQL